MHFEPSNLKIGPEVWALQVRKNKVRKGKEQIIWVGISQISGGEWGGVIITKFRTRVYIGPILPYNFSNFWC